MRSNRPGFLALVTSIFVACSLLPAAAIASPVSGAYPAGTGTEAAFVHFRPGTRGQLGLVRAAGLRPVVALRSVDVVYAEGSASAFSDLAADVRVTGLERDRQLALLNDTATIATGVQELRSEPVRYHSPTGQVLDGAGVGVAVIDTGILGSHPDLSDRMGANYKIVCNGCPLAEVPDSDTSSGHGTHVAGIVAGTGVQSAGRFAGVAPGATLFGYGAGDTLYVLHAAVAFDHIIENYDDFDPRIRVVTNSYGAPDDFDPDSVISKMVDELVSRGTTVVWAAGNSGGDGSADMVVDDAKNPLPGVIAVGNYNDGDSGSTDAAVYSGSSRGAAGSPETYPDVVAPGTRITSTCIQELQPVCHLGFGVTTASHPWYSTIGGTSMAAPHVAGLAALLYQADPLLTPAQVEDLLQDSAHKLVQGAPYEPDPQNPGGTVAFDKGAGLVDIMAAVEMLQERKDPPRKKRRRG